MDETAAADPVEFTDHTETHIFPHGFKSRRVMMSATSNIPQMSWYESTISAAEDGTRIFRVCELSRALAADAGSERVVCEVSGPSAGAAWKAMQMNIDACHGKESPSTSVAFRANRTNHLTCSPYHFHGHVISHCQVKGSARGAHLRRRRRRR